jgi:hypothetical protein
MDAQTDAELRRIRDTDDPKKRKALLDALNTRTRPYRAPRGQQAPEPPAPSPAPHAAPRPTSETGYKPKRVDPREIIKPEITTRRRMREAEESMGFAKGGKVRGDGCAQRGKTKGTMR